MFKETIKNRVESNRCPVCDVEFTEEYLKDNDVRKVYYADLQGEVRICKKHNFFEEK